MSDNETRVTDLLLIEEREKAIKVRKGLNEYWLPKAEITISRDPIRPGQQFRGVSVTMPDWLADSKGL